MNDSYLAYQARFLHDSLLYKSVRFGKFKLTNTSQLIAIKILLGIIALPLLWKIRDYKRYEHASEIIIVIQESDGP